MPRIALVLGLLGAVGPFAIDMYLPALPTVAADLGASIQGVQATLSAFFIAFGVSQLVYGPLSDRMGRRPPLLIGLGVFLAGTLGCALAPDVGWLTAARVVQGVGAAAVMVVPRAVIRDLHSGPAAARMMATIMLVIAVSPMLAPLAGSGVMAVAGWRAIFGVLAVAGAISIFLTLFALPETLAPADRKPIRAGDLGRSCLRLLGDRQFLGLTFSAGFGIASFFVFIASASFVYAESFGLGPTAFSLAFALNALGFFGASQAAGPLGGRFGMARVVIWGSAGFAAVSLSLLGLTLAGFGGLATIVVMLFLANACLGVVIPTTSVLALDPHPDIAGLASSLAGTLQMVAGGLMIALLAPFFDGTPLPMVAAIALCGGLALVAALALVTAGPRPCVAD